MGEIYSGIEYQPVKRKMTTLRYKVCVARSLGLSVAVLHISVLDFWP